MICHDPQTFLTEDNMKGKYMARTLLTVTALITLGSTALGDWAPAGDKIKTRWVKDIDPAAPLPEYPRPVMVRDAWANLNGLWDYAITDKDATAPGEYDGKILVPFPIESALSGVQKEVGTSKRLWYRRTFTVPEAWNTNRILLQLGGVDWEAAVYVNGREMGRHRGGYDAWSVDMTDALKAAGEQELLIAVWDPTDDGYQPRGKQVKNPEGIWYTSVTGIWQTVWMEPVAKNASIAALKTVPDIDAGTVSVEVVPCGDASGCTVTVRALENGSAVASASGAPGTALTLKMENAKRWSPDTPFLYDLSVTLEKDGHALDTVASYFGMRKISLAKDEDGFNRLFLNNEPLFQFGPLDQGWWPDGLYTAPTDEALRYDVQVTRDMGFNMARKHVKVEPARWYYHCDQLGLMVWQDMPSGDAYIGPDDPDIKRSPESRENFYNEWAGIIDMLRNNPSVVMWVPFNEGWGQFDTNAVSDWTKNYDPTRLVNQASGWADRKGGDVHDKHNYPAPAMFPVEENRVSVLGEFGGLGWAVEGHLWWNNRNWGYRTYESKEQLAGAYEDLVFTLRTLIPQGLAAAVYTQTTDVEGEINGLLTYDRALMKMELNALAAINKKVYGAPLTMTVLAPTSEEVGQPWRYTLEKPEKGWQAPDFDDSGWQEGPGVLGTEGTPGAKVRTVWNTGDIWARRVVDLPELGEGEVRLSIHHDEDARVYINGVRAVKLEGYTTGYTQVMLQGQALDALKPGRNVLAVHCSQTGGGQCIDLGLVLIQE